jgi:hypothetical protein
MYSVCVWQDSLWDKMADMRFRPFSVGKFVVCGNDRQHFGTLVPNFCLRSLNHKRTMRQATATGAFQEFTLQAQPHDATPPLSIITSVSLWPWPSVSCSNCQCLQYLQPSATPADTQWHWPVSLTTAYNLMLSGIMTIKILTYNFSTKTKNKITEGLFLSQYFLKVLLSSETLGQLK